MASGAVHKKAPKEHQESGGRKIAFGGDKSPLRKHWPSISEKNEVQTTSESLQADPMKGNCGEFSLNSDEEYLYIPMKGSQHLCHMRTDCESSLKLENVTQQYEERITELHSVIAELTRKLDRQKEDIILEEEEEEYEEDEEVREEYEDEISSSRRRKQRRNKSRNQRDGVSLSEMSSHEQNEKTECSTSDTAESDGMYNADECHETGPQPSTDISTSCDIDDRAVEAGQCIADLEVEECRGENNSNLSLCQPTNDNGTNGTDEIVGDDVMCQESSSIGIEEEMKMLREENLNLQQALALSHHKASSQRAVILALSREREMFKRKVKELERMHPGIPHTSPHISDAIMVKGLRGSPLSMALSTPLNSSLDISVNNTSRAVSPSVISQPLEEESSTQEGVKVICKLAERVRLKKAESGDFRVTGSELSNYGITTTGVAEQLAAGLQEESDAQELYHALATAGGAFAPHERLKEYELEAERLHSRIDHLRAQNDVLAATLCESKACCDRLALKTGRAEAQSGALRMGVEVLDQIQEAFEVLTALHEAQIGLLVVTCQVTGVDLGTELGFESLYQDADPLIRIKRAQEQRRTAENVARHLISRLEEARPKSMNGPSDSNGIHSMSSSTSSFCSEGTPHQEEQMLREMISRLQKERTRILSGFKCGDDNSPMEDYFPPKPPLNEEEAHKFDLENAVLMQELTAIREDRAELRAQVYLLEREKTGLELRVGTCEAQAAAYVATIDHLKSQLNEFKSSPSKPQESVEDSGAETCSSEAESLRRESQLKNRIDDLVATLEKVTKNSEARHQQSQEFISDLKKANSSSNYFK
ncbi:Usher syndrome type-1C protein-binding protein 1 [Armadillidium vulgare]|nr:Usher syndrome type-1C protein-binding protein 1 [Armadillidium vulgare]